KSFIKENPDGIFRMELEGNFKHVNESLAKMAGLPLDQIIGSSFIPFCSPCHKVLVLDNFALACKGRITSFEADFISAQGNKLILKVLLMPLFMDGKVTEIHGIAKDVTEIRNNEKV
ncbi:PAS domain-containing protein, partial [Salinimicrobium oceani]